MALNCAYSLDVGFYPSLIVDQLERRLETIGRAINVHLGPELKALWIAYARTEGKRQVRPFVRQLNSCWLHLPHRCPAVV